MPGVVSDSSTLIHMAALGHLALLRELFGNVLIAPAVWKEVVEEGRGRAGARAVEEAVRSGWLRWRYRELLYFLVWRDVRVKDVAVVS